MSPTFKVSLGDEAAEAFRVKAKGLARTLPMAAALEVLRNCRRFRPTLSLHILDLPLSKNLQGIVITLLTNSFSHIPVRTF